MRNSDGRSYARLSVTSRERKRALERIRSLALAAGNAQARRSGLVINPLTCHYKQGFPSLLLFLMAEDVMRKLLLAVWVVALWCGAASAAPADDEARAIIERAIKAHGGFDRLSRVRADQVKCKGALFVNDKDTPFLSETTVQPPNQFRNVFELQGARKAVFVETLNGDKVSFSIDGQPQKVEDGLATEVRETMQLNRIIRLVPLLTDKAYTLQPLGEVKIDDQPALGVKATAKGRREARLFFHKTSGLLIKTEHIMEDDAGKKVMQEELYSDFKDDQGYKRPMKITAYRNGKKIMEANILDVKYLDKVDEEEFTKP